MKVRWGGLLNIALLLVIIWQAKQGVLSPPPAPLPPLPTPLPERTFEDAPLVPRGEVALPPPPEPEKIDPRDETLVILRTWGDIGHRKRALIKRYLAGTDGIARFAVNHDATRAGNQSSIEESVAHLQELAAGPDGGFDLYVYNETDVKARFPHTTFDIGFLTNYNPWKKTGTQVLATYQGAAPSTVLFLRTFPTSRLEKLKNVWIIEDDVMFTGDLKQFFGRYVDDESHIITSRFRDMPMGWWWEHSFTWNATKAHKTVQEDHVTRYSMRLLKLLDDLVSVGVYALGVHFPTTVCSSLVWCRESIRNLDPDGVIAEEKYYAASARVSEDVWNDAVAGKIPELSGKWVHATKWDDVPGKAGAAGSSATRQPPARRSPPEQVAVAPLPQVDGSPLDLNLHPTVVNVGGVEFAYELPPGTKPTAVLLIFPSCRFVHFDFWILGQLREMVHFFVGKGYAVISINGPRQSKADKVVSCPDYMGTSDNRQVKEFPGALSKLFDLLGKDKPELAGLSSVPLYAYGISAGGFVISMVTKEVPMTAAVYQVAIPEQNSVHAKHPPTLFQRMAEDFHATAAKVADARAKFAALGVETDELVQARTFEISRDPATGRQELSWFFEGITPKHSQELIKLYCDTSPKLCNVTGTDAKGVETFTLEHILAEDRRKVFVPKQAEFLGGIMDYALAFYRRVVVSDVVAWHTTAKDDADAKLLWDFLVGKGYIVCWTVDGSKLCHLAKAEVSKADWAELLANDALASAARKKLLDYYDFVLEMTFQLLVHEHCAWTRGLLQGWHEWYGKHEK
ncbi:hypothetical protein DFJ74DRAFT_649770 [Hyaloraphidium curvatum]|nr:hypothetical protein DFJ74DRAFT_649770 [Hyaloraphidium curvatum]